MLIKGILFDLDGTLLDRDRSLLALLEDQYYRIFAPLEVNQAPFIQRFIELDQRGSVWKDKVYQTLIEEFNLDLDWRALLDDYMREFQHHCIGMPGLFEMLDFCKEKGLKLGIISNGYGRFQMDNIRGLGISSYFDEILISEWEGLRKPDIAIFQRAMDRLGLSPEEALFVGDHPINDVEASIQAGMKGIWKEDRYYASPSLEHAAVQELEEIKDVIRSLLNR